MNNDPAFPEFWSMDLLTHSVIFIRILKEHIPGGPIVSAPEKKTPDGESIIFLSPPL